jgi:hypothetical protein
MLEWFGEILGAIGETILTIVLMIAIPVFCCCCALGFLTHR